MTTWSPPFDPDTTVSYTRDWSTELDPVSDTLATSQFVLPADALAATIAIHQQSNTTKTSTLWLKATTPATAKTQLAGKSIYITLNVTTAGGRALQDTIELLVLDGGGVFVVEDGSGLSTANSYCSLATADSYWLSRDDAAWRDSSASARKAAIVRATEYIDSRFSKKFVGYLVVETQALAWPRQGAYDAEGRQLIGVPSAVVRATCALSHIALTAPLYRESTETVVKSRRREVGPIVDQVEYAAGGAGSVEIRFVEVDALLKSVLRGYGDVSVIRV